ncbi:MAG: T9SS type A sorting domain-containing protein [Bacteroidia bacterium]|jgi:hypothetical protein|nr:T9SS type A sorting domain-containing protein [Bacteroidia bacterium]
MKKQIITALSTLLLVNFSNASIVNTPINKTVDSITTSYQLDVTNDGAYDITFNYFANGSITITGRIGNGNNNYLATGTISGGNNYPIKVNNNQIFKDLNTWKSNPIFIQSPALGYSDFAGKGNQYIVGRMNYGTPELFYFWILVNVSSNGAKLNIIKCAYETEADSALATGNEGQISSGTFINNNFNNYSFSVFPQPANNQIEIQTNEIIQGYKIFSINGQLLNEQNYLKNSIIDVANLPKGIYLLQLLNNKNFISTKKIIIE